MKLTVVMAVASLLTERGRIGDERAEARLLR